MSLIHHSLKVSLNMYMEKLLRALLPLSLFPRAGINRFKGKWQHVHWQKRMNKFHHHFPFNSRQLTPLKLAVGPQMFAFLLIFKVNLNLSVETK